MDDIEKRIEKFINGDEGYRYLMTKYVDLKFLFIKIINELENLEANSDLMTSYQFRELGKLNKNYRDEFLEIIKHIAENE